MINTLESVVGEVGQAIGMNFPKKPGASVIRPAIIKKIKGVIMATISVDVFDKAEIKEDQTTEFKTSIFVDPKKSHAGFAQMRTIADTLAAFMNVDGGMLYVGIADNKDVRGIE